MLPPGHSTVGIMQPNVDTVSRRLATFSTKEASEIRQRILDAIHYARVLRSLKIRQPPANCHVIWPSPQCDLLKSTQNVDIAMGAVDVGLDPHATRKGKTRTTKYWIRRVVVGTDMEGGNRAGRILSQRHSLACRHQTVLRDVTRRRGNTDVCRAGVPPITSRMSCCPLLVRPHRTTPNLPRPRCHS
jgi:hypothetical protein